MSQKDSRRTLVRREAPLSVSPKPAPYTTLGQASDERFKLDPSGFQLQPLSVSSGQSAYVADLLSRGLGDIAQQLASAESQARAAQSALEAAQAADTTSELKKNLKDWRVKETADVNEQINEELRKQGITNEDLRRNANLRKTVNEWKAKIYAELNKSLSENEQTAIAEVQESLTKAQQKARAQLEASIAAYGAQVGRAVEKQQAEQQKIMSDAGFTGSWADFSKLVEVQQQAVSDLSKAGVVSQSGDTVTVTKPLSDLSDSEIVQLQLAGFDISKEHRDQANAVESLVASGVINQSGDNLVLDKPLYELSDSEIVQLQLAGFDISPQDVEQAEVEAHFQATAQLRGVTWAARQARQEIYQNALNTLVSAGVVSQQGNTFSLSKDVSDLSNAEIAQLNTVGMNITVQQRDQLRDVSSLVNAGVISRSGDNLFLNTPLHELSGSDVKQLQNVGFKITQQDVDVAKNVADFESSAQLRGVTSMLKTAKSQAAALALQNQINSLVEKGVIKRVGPELGPIAPDAGYTVTKQLPELSDSELKQLQNVGFNLTPEMLSQSKTIRSLMDSGIVKLDGDSVTLAKPVDKLSKSEVNQLNSIGMDIKRITPLSSAFGPSLAYWDFKTGELHEQIGWDEQNQPVFAKVVKGDQLSPAESRALLGQTMVTTVALPLAKPVLGLFAAGGVGVSEGVKYGLTGEHLTPEEVIYAASMGAAIGSGALALNQKYNLTGKIGITNPEKMSKLIRLTNGNIKVTASGEIETGYTQIKNVPKQLRDLYALELDKLTGKVKVVGFITKSGGKNVVQPIIREYDATFLDDLMRAKQVGPRAVKTVLVKRLGEDGFKQLQSVTLKDGGKQLIEMSPLEIQKAMYKELGYGSQYVRAIQNFSKEKPLLLHKDTHIEYLGSVGDVKDIGKLRMPAEVQRLYKDLKALGFDTVESRYWASQILTKSPEKIVGKMENIIDNAYSQQKLMELSAKYNASGKGSTLVSGLKAEGFTDAQLEKVVKLIAQSIDDPRGFAAGVNNLKASDSQLVALFKGVPTESLGISLTYMDVKPLVSLVGAADSALRANLVSVMSSSMLAGVVGKLSVEGVNSVTPHISQNNLVYLFSNPDVKTDVKADLVKSMTPEQLNAAVPKVSPSVLNDVIPQLGEKELPEVFRELTPTQLNSVFTSMSSNQLNMVVPKLSPEAFADVFLNLSPAQFNAVIPKLSPEAFNEIVPQLSPAQVSAVLEKFKITPETMMQYLGVTVPHGATQHPGKIQKLLKPLIERKIAENKKEMAKQAVSVYDITLQYYAASERFKIKANSFQGAVQQSLVRRKSKQVPKRVVVALAGKQ